MTGDSLELVCGSGLSFLMQAGAFFRFGGSPDGK